MSNHAPILLQQIKTKMLTTKQKICYYIIKLRENKYKGGKQNEKFNEDGNKSIQ